MSLPPIAEHIDAIRTALAQTCQVVLEAPPGAGKSTYLPLQLLAQPWLQGQKILLLEPRRLAARAVAEYLAAQLGEPLGQQIGLRMRNDSQISAATRLEVVTEGVLIRQLQQDPELSGIGLVIFDEFHERSLQADVGLALCLDVQNGLRDDLRLLVMSATLEGMDFAALLPQRQTLHCPGRAYPVEIRYLPQPPQRDLVERVVQATQQALQQETGGVLVFLPGAREIRAVAERLHVSAEVDICPLFGGLSFAEQRRAITPAAPGRRKVVLATNIAETSLTIDGIRVVVDSGVERQALHNLKTGQTRLQSRQHAQASATQRAGRAGRLCAGVAYRLWSEEQHSRREMQAAPAIEREDLTSTVLECARWGVSDPSGLIWMTAPPATAWQWAQARLQWLDALDEEGRITRRGLTLAQLGLAPELGHLLLSARELSGDETLLTMAAVVAAMLADGVNGRAGRADLRSWLNEASAAQLQQARRWLQLLGQGGAKIALQRLPTERLGELLALAFPAWIAQRRGDSYRCAGGFGVQLHEADRAWAGEWLAVARFNDSDRSSQPLITLAAPVSLARIRDLHAAHLVNELVLDWHEQKNQIEASRVERLQALILASSPVPAAELDAEQIAALLCEQIRKRGLQALQWDEQGEQLRYRLQLAAAILDETRWPGSDEQALLDSLEQWLVPFLGSVRSLTGITASMLRSALLARLDYAQQQLLEQAFPTHWQTPAGGRAPIRYRAEGAPLLSVRLQEMLGQAATPTVGLGRQPLLIELLSPAQRPLQVTQDLAGFWGGAYREVQKEMKGRYPKHYWPDDPASALPTQRTKKQMMKD